MSCTSSECVLHDTVLLSIIGPEKNISYYIVLSAYGGIQTNKPLKTHT